MYIERMRTRAKDIPLKLLIFYPGVLSRADQALPFATDSTHCAKPQRFATFLLEILNRISNPGGPGVFREGTKE
jgi:hypothetical protein